MSREGDSTLTLAVFCDYENVAIGARDISEATDEEPFRVDLILERLLDKGEIVVKKAYADWTRYQDARRPLHEAAFELVEVPHVSYSGKNSADIRLVVDALDLCHTKSLIGGFVIVSGDSDFSPLVSKLRENGKRVIGVGVKTSTSDLLVGNCDEFIYYDELVKRRKGRRRRRAKGPERGADQEAMDLVLDTIDALTEERDELLRSSLIKQTLKRKRPNFSEGRYGFRTFNQLLEEAERRGLLKLEKDTRSGGYFVTEFDSRS